MKATELFHKDGKTAGVWYCGECRLVTPSETIAEDCCKPRKCKCGAELQQYRYSLCEECESEASRKREEERFEAAEKLTSWDGWVWDGADFYSDSDELIQRCEDDGDPVPAYVWTCDPVRFVIFSIEEVKDRICSSGEAYEDFDPNDLNGLDELEKAIDAFNAANENVVSYQVNHARALILNPSEKPNS